MILEKDFLYRVPVKTAPITTPRGQIRNPEILVDLEGGEFMHGNILDANSTNKLINQSVKDAVDNKLIESGYVTKDLLDAETTRATGVESGLQAAIATKADAAALSNYVLTTALNLQVDTLNTAISAKLDAGSYIPYDQTVTSLYKIDNDLMIDNSSGRAVLSTYNISAISNSNTEILINPTGITMIDDDNVIRLNRSGVTLPDGDNDHVLTSYGSTLNMANYLKESDVSGLFAAKADRSDLIALELKITANTTAIEGKLDKGNYIEYSSKDNDGYTIDCEFNTSEPITVDGGTGYLTYVTLSGIETHDSSGKLSNLTVTSLSIASGPTTRTTYTINGIITTLYKNCLATSDGTFKPISDFVLKENANEEYVRPEDFENLEQAVSGLSRKVSSKLDTITVNAVDVTNLETADITQLRAIVKDLLNALKSSGLIIESQGVE